MKAAARKIMLALMTTQFIPMALANPEQQNDHYFTSEVVDKLWNIIDMIPGVNKRIMGIMLQVHHELQKMKDGDPFNNHEGIYTFQGNALSIEALANFEDECEFAYQNGTMEKKEYTQNMALLKSCLTDVKKDFDNKLSKFLGLAHQAKECLLILIKESCDKHNRSNSFLLSWGEVTDENDMKAFYANLKTFKDYHEFLVDLSNFMKDLINRSPRAKAEFMELVKRSKQQKNR